MSMYKHFNFIDNNLTQIESMYYRSNNEYKNLKKKLKEALKENKKLKTILNDYDKNTHSFID